MPEPPVTLPSGILVWNGKPFLIVKIGGHDVIGSPGDLIVSDEPVHVGQFTEVREILGVSTPGPPP